MTTQVFILQSIYHFKIGTKIELMTIPGTEDLVVLSFPVVLQCLLSFEILGRLAKFAQKRTVFVFCLVSEHVLFERLGIS